MGLRLNLLGGFEARIGDGEPIVFPRKKAQALLAYLVLQPDRAHPRGKLASLLWGDTGDAAARASLRQALATLRQSLPEGASPVAVDADSVRTALNAVALDVREFERLAKEREPTSLAAAADLYRGDLLAGLGPQSPEFEQWLLAERERLRELALEALAALLAHYRKGAALEPAVQTALKLLSLDPLQEAVQRALMRLYSAQGRRGPALRQYQVCVNVMQRELGTEPEDETKQLYQEILRSRSLPAPASDERPTTRTRPHSSRMAAAEATLIGRDAELARLRDALNPAGEGHGAVVFVLGEAGIGKSRLLSELAREAIDSGHRVLVGHCHETERILALGPWTDLLRGAIDAAMLRDIEPVWRAEICRLLPELGPAPASVGQDHGRLFSAVLEILQRLASQSRIVLMLEDLHWADDMTLRLVAFVARRIQAAPLTIIASARDDEIAPALSALLDELDREPHVTRGALSPLTRGDTAALTERLVRAGTASAAVADLADRVWTASEGNPFVIVETVRALDQPTGRVESHGLAVPERVRRLIEARLDRLDRVTQDVMVASAVIGRTFDFALLQRSVGLDDRDTAVAVEELVRRRILGAVGEQLDFVHDRIRETAYRRLVSPRRRALHAAVAAAIESSSPHFADRLDFHAAVAHHAYESRDFARALGHSIAAGRRSAERFAWDDALVHLERARECAAALGRADDDIDEAIGDLRFQHGRLDAAVASYERARASTTVRARQAEVDVKIGRVYTEYADVRGPAVLRRALEGLDEGTQRPLVGLANAMLGRYAHHDGRLGEARAWLERAEAIAERDHDTQALGQTYWWLAGVYQHLDLLDESEQYAQKLIAVSDPESTAMCIGLTYLAEAAYSQGQWDASVDYSLRSEDVARRMGAEHRMAFSIHDRARALYGRGDLTAAAEAAGNALRLADATGQRRVGVYSLFVLSRIEADLGLGRQALEHADRAVIDGDVLGALSLRASAREALAYVRHEQGIPAADVVDEWLALYRGVDHVWTKVHGGAHMSEALFADGRPDQAADLASETIQRAERSGSRHWEALARRVLGQILTARGRLGEAQAQLDEAVAKLDALGSRLELGRALDHRARLHETRSESRRAHADLTTACEIFSAIGAARDLERATR